MRTVFRYELRRVMLDKFYLGMLVLLGLYGWMVLTGQIILGVANTAPFSAWSFGAYLAKLLPFMLAIVLFCLAELTGRRARAAAPVIDATPADKRSLLAVRCAAVGVGYFVAALVVIGIGCLFESSFFEYTGFGAYVVPVLMTFLPALMLILGLGLVAVRKHVALVYGLLFVVLVISQFPLPGFADVTGVRFFTEYPRTLAAGLDGERAFQVPVAVVLGKLLCTGIGAACIGWAIARAGRTTLKPL